MDNKISTVEKGSWFEFIFYCEGCGHSHGFRTATWEQPTGLTEEQKKLFQHKWTFNGNLEKPTIRPSLHIWIEDKNGNKTTTCHSFVTDGKIEYLSDCRHKLAGKTIDMPDF